MSKTVQKYMFKRFMELVRLLQQAQNEGKKRDESREKEEKE